MPWNTEAQTLDTSQRVSRTMNEPFLNRCARNSQVGDLFHHGPLDYLVSTVKPSSGSSPVILQAELNEGLCVPVAPQSHPLMADPLILLQSLPVRRSGSSPWDQQRRSKQDRTQMPIRKQMELKWRCNDSDEVAHLLYLNP